MVLDLQHAELLSVSDREVIGAFGRAAGHDCRVLTALAQTGSGRITAALWARALQREVVLVGSVPEGLRVCLHALGTSLSNAGPTAGPVDLPELNLHPAPLLALRATR